MPLAGIGFDSKRDFAPLLSCWGFSFTLECEVSFFGGIQHSPVDGCSAIIGQVLYAVPFAFGLIDSIHFHT